MTHNYECKKCGSTFTTIFTEVYGNQKYLKCGKCFHKDYDFHNNNNLEVPKKSEQFSKPIRIK